MPPGWAWATLGDLVETIDSGKNVSAIGRPPTLACTLEVLVNA